MRQGSSVSLNSNDGQMPGRIPLTVMQERFTASIVTYKHHLLDIEPVLRSLFASPVTTIWIIDHSYDIMPHLLKELNEFTGRVLTGEPVLREKVEKEGLKVVYIRHKNNGYGGGQNVALREAMKEGSRYHLVVNPDVWFGPRVMPALLDYMSRHEDVGQMMPQVLYPTARYSGWQNSSRHRSTSSAASASRSPSYAAATSVSSCGTWTRRHPPTCLSSPDASCSSAWRR